AVQPCGRRRRHHRVHAEHVADPTLVAHAHLEDLHTGRESDYGTAVEVLQWSADSQSADPQEPADSVERLRIPAGSPRKGTAPHVDVPRGADGPDRARGGREQGVSRQERDGRAAYPQAALGGVEVSYARQHLSELARV